MPHDPTHPSTASSPGADVPPSAPAARRSRRPPEPRASLWSERRSRVMGWRSLDVLRAGALLLGLYYFLRLLWFANQLVLITFLGVLFGLAVSSAVDWLHGHGLQKLPRGVLAAVIVLGTIGAIVGFFIWSGPTLATEFRELRTRIPEAIDQAEDWLVEQRGGLLANVVLGREAPPTASDTLILTPMEPTGRPAAPPVAAVPAPRTAGDSAAGALLRLRDSLIAGDTLGQRPAGIDSLLTVAAERARLAAATAEAADVAAAAPPPTPAPAAPMTLVPQAADSAAAPIPLTLRDRAMDTLSGVTRYFFPFLTSTFAVFAGLLLVIFLSIYVAAQPRLYKRGIMHLFPQSARPRAEEVLGAIALVLRKWLVTQMIAMLVIGTVTTIVLYVLDVPAALPLGIIAGLFEFIPNIGPLLSAVPAVAMGFVDSPEKALYVALAYWVIQFLENQLLIPILMQEGVDLPPALTLIAQALLAIVFGFVGLFVAVPLVAAGMVTVRMLYVEDVVGDDVDPLDREEPDDEGGPGAPIPAPVRA